jgi:ABC-2 type transport system ATP-binding protein
VTGSVAEFRSVTKTYGDTAAVENLTVDIGAGRIVGLLGRNGAGKTTSLRVLLGLATATSGQATVFGTPYPQLRHAAHRVGVSMDGIGPLPGVSGRKDLMIWARALGLGRTRVDEVLHRVGLADSAHKKIKGYSTGMRQRHALATALLADPELLVLDEPANGLDPDGIRWLRWFLRGLADEGRTVLLSSHLLSEVEQIVDDVVVIQQTLRYAGPLAALTSGGSVPLEHRFFQLVGQANGARTHA